MQGYYRSLKTEMPHIDVTIFCPGPTSTEFLQHAFTANQGESLGQETIDTSNKRMTSERCGQLMAIAIANQLELCYCGPFPVPLLTYIFLNYPNIASL